MSLTKMGGQVALTVTPAEKGKIFWKSFKDALFLVCLVAIGRKLGKPEGARV